MDGGPNGRNWLAVEDSDSCTNLDSGISGRRMIRIVPIGRSARVDLDSSSSLLVALRHRRVISIDWPASSGML